MILSCNSCEKKFVVPDNAIGVDGRLVQCSSCGNKWKQFPINQRVVQKEKKVKTAQIRKESPKIIKKSKQKKVKKKTGPDLYSPEYLAKKHGIRIDTKPIVKNKSSDTKTKVKFGFYNTLIVFIIFIISIIRIIYFSENAIISYVPSAESYLSYLFETIRNIKEIIEDFILGY